MARTKSSNDNFEETRLIDWGKDKGNYTLNYYLNGEKKTLSESSKSELKAKAKKLGISLDETFERKSK